MELLYFSHILVVLFSVDTANSHQVSAGLACVNDLVNNISCSWHGPRAASGTNCLISGEKKTWRKGTRAKMIRNCRVKQPADAPPGCSFIFENNEFTCLAVLPYIRMECDGMLVGNLINYNPCHHIKMHPPGTPNISSSTSEVKISWSPSSPLSLFLTDLDFQIQIKQKNKGQEDVKIFSTQKHELQLLLWKLKGHCQAKVRVQPRGNYSSQWSDWSPTASWMGATEGEEARHDQEHFQMSLSTWAVIGSLAIILIVMLVILRCCFSRRLHKMKPVPNPSKYFQTLYSVHGGNLTEWINPLSAPKSFFVAPPSDHISSVELSENWDVMSSTSPSSASTRALLHFQSFPASGSDTSGVVDPSSSSSSSFFSNMGYFMSSSSKSSAQTDPSLAYFVYQDDFHNMPNSHTLHLSLLPPFNTAHTYESLKMEPQSPDSGFGLGREDEEDMQALAVMPEHQQTSPFLILPLHLPPQMLPQFSPSSSLNTPSPAQVSCESLQVDEAVQAASGSYTAWPSAGAMCRSSSMPVEPMKTGYLTLKDLHTTFSNKSI